MAKNQPTFGLHPLCSQERLLKTTAKKELHTHTHAPIHSNASCLFSAPIFHHSFPRIVMRLFTFMTYLSGYFRRNMPPLLLSSARFVSPIFAITPSNLVRFLLFIYLGTHSSAPVVCDWWKICRELKYVWGVFMQPAHVTSIWSTCSLPKYHSMLFRVE